MAPSLAAKALVGWTTLLDEVKFTPCLAVALEARPSMQLVMVLLFCFWTPRIIMQR
jgi:hypothetical protein